MNRLFSIKESLGDRAEPSRSGMTLSEVMVSMTLVAMLAGGLMMMGMRARALVEHNRLVTEARSLAKERVEEMLSLGVGELLKPSCTVTNQDVMLSSQGHQIFRRPIIIWHAADFSIVTDPDDAAYLEAHVHVSFMSPNNHKMYTDGYGVILKP